ncbi:MAG TPA: lmo0937 family membrane protein [Candidatus Saccharimonadales bacterium]|nr:lmo0937 family membrane protein [Candidatus Saccharimonadales bacterium]
MLLTIVIVLGILWLLGLIAHIGGGLIHLVLLIALIVLVYDFVTRRRHHV